jgi:hypothetical protein
MPPSCEHVSDRRTCLDGHLLWFGEPAVSNRDLLSPAEQSRKPRAVDARVTALHPRGKPGAAATKGREPVASGVEQERSPMSPPERMGYSSSRPAAWSAALIQPGLPSP